MASLQIDSAAVNTARQAGYSDAEIVAHLAAKNPEQFKAAESAGYSPTEVLDHVAPAPKGLLSKAIDFIGNEGNALRKGAADAVGGTGETLKQFGPNGSGNALKSAAAAIAPKNYSAPQVIDKDGVHASALPEAVTEAAPGMAAAIAAARVAPGGLWGKLLAGSGTYALMNLGNRAKERAAANTGDQNAEPTTTDKAVSAAAMIPEAAVGSIGLSRFLPGAGAVTRVGAAGLRDSAAQLAKTVAAEGASTAGQNAVAQVGQTIGTPGGVSVDPTQVANAGVIGGATGGLMAAPRAAAEAAGVNKYRAFGGDNKTAATEVANEIQAAAGGGDKLTPGFVNAKTKEGYHALREVADANAVELSRATSELKQTTQLSPAAEGVLKRAQGGEALTPRDHEILDASLQGAPNGADVAHFARKASVIAMLKDQGNFNDAKEKFTGGLTPKVTGLVGRTLPSAVGLSLLAEATGSHILVQSPKALAAIAGAATAARVLDKLTGNINPANRFAQRFADPNAPLRPQAGPPLSAPSGPWGASGPGPTGPQVPPVPVKPMAVPAGLAALLAAHVRQANRDSRFDDNQTKLQAMPLLRALAARSQMQQQAAQPAPPVDPVVAQREQMKSAIDLMSARRANQRLAEQNTPPPAPAPVVPEPTPAINPMALPREITGPANNLTAGMLMAAKAREAYAASQQKAAGSAQAEDLARNSPLVDAAGGLDALRNPDMGKRASALVSAANAVKKLTAQPPEETEAPPVVTKVTKVDGKVKTQTEPAPKMNGASYDEAPLRASRTSINAADNAIADKAVQARVSTGVPMPESAVVNYRKSTAQRQALHRDRLIEISGDEHFPSDNMPLMEALDKIRTEVKTPAELQAHVEDIATNHPEAAQIVRKFFGPKWANSIWHPTKKK